MQLLIVIATFIISILTALVVFQKNPRSGTHVYFALLVFFIGIYPVFNYLAIHAVTNHQALFWAKMILLVSIPQGPLLYFFAKTYPTTRLIFRLRLQMIVLGWVILNMILAVAGLIFQGVVVKDGVVTIQPGPVVPSFGILHVTTIIAGLSVLFRKYRRSKGMNRQQLTYVFFGILISFSLTFIITFILPILLNSTFLLAISPIFLTMSVVAAAYAIVKHRLFDIRAAAARTMAYLLSLGSIVIIYSVVVLV
jgi:hypothetical protein